MDVGHRVNLALTHFRKYTERIGKYTLLGEVKFVSLFSLSFLVCPLLPIHRSCWGLLLDLIAFNDTHTFGRTPLDEGSARRRDLYLITHNIQNRQPCSRRDVNPQSQQTFGRRPRGHPDRPVRLLTIFPVSMKVTLQNLQISTRIIELLRRMFVVPISSVFYAQSY